MTRPTVRASTGSLGRRSHLERVAKLSAWVLVGPTSIYLGNPFVNRSENSLLEIRLWSFIANQCIFTPCQNNCNKRYTSLSRVTPAPPRTLLPVPNDLYYDQVELRVTRPTEWRPTGSQSEIMTAERVLIPRGDGAGQTPDPFIKGTPL